MATDALAQHPPAIRVGGRRLSLNSRPRPAAPTADAQRANPPPADTPPDYPRPAAPGEQQVLHHQQQQQEEEVPKKKHGTGGDEHERRLQESLFLKAEHNRPKKEIGTGPKVTNRISQPAGKGFGA